VAQRKKKSCFLLGSGGANRGTSPFVAGFFKRGEGGRVLALNKGKGQKLTVLSGTGSKRNDGIFREKKEAGTSALLKKRGRERKCEPGEKKNQVKRGKAFKNSHCSGLEKRTRRRGRKVPWGGGVTCETKVSERSGRKEEALSTHNGKIKKGKKLWIMRKKGVQEEPRQRKLEQEPGGKRGSKKGSR